MIGGDVGVLEGRGDLVLARSDLVVPRLDGNAQFVQPPLHLGHVRHDALGDRAEVVVVELLALRRRRADERAPADQQVRPLVEEASSIRKYSCSQPRVVMTCETPSSAPKI